MSTEEVIAPITAGELLEKQEDLTFKDRQEGIVGTLADPDELKRFTYLGRRDPVLFAKILYAHMDIDAIEAWENKVISGEAADYIPPSMPEYLVVPDLHLRVSREGFLIKVYKSISHLVESASQAVRGFFGRKRE